MIKRIKHFLTTCYICYGMGVKEKTNGETIECPVCKGKGFL